MISEGKFGFPLGSEEKAIDKVEEKAIDKVEEKAIDKVEKVKPLRNLHSAPGIYSSVRPIVAADDSHVDPSKGALREPPALHRKSFFMFNGMYDGFLQFTTEEFQSAAMASEFEVFKTSSINVMALIFLIILGTIYTVRRRSTFLNNLCLFLTFG